MEANDNEIEQYLADQRRHRGKVFLIVGILLTPASVIALLVWPDVPFSIPAFYYAIPYLFLVCGVVGLIRGIALLAGGRDVIEELNSSLERRL